MRLMLEFLVGRYGVFKMNEFEIFLEYENLVQIL